MESFWERTKEGKGSTVLVSVYNLCGLAEVRLLKGEIDTAEQYAEKALHVSLDIQGRCEEGTSYHVLEMIHR
ncbi:MAG: hypothetical protein ACQEQM_03310 [Thermoplasmatota archaeon]